MRALIYATALLLFRRQMHSDAHGQTNIDSLNRPVKYRASDHKQFVERCADCNVVRVFSVVFCVSGPLGTAHTARKLCERVFASLRGRLRYGPC